MSQQVDLWKGPFGNNYQIRNLLTEEEVGRRYAFFETVFKVIYMNSGVIPVSVLEIGAGQGPNIKALEKLQLMTQKPLKLYATEVNEHAAERLQDNCKSVNYLEEIPKLPTADLVFTYGVLIHTHPAHVKGLMNKIYTASNRFIMCCEYFAPEIRPITYRGEKDALWLDDYGSLYIGNFSLRSIGYGFLWKKTTGLDNITFHIFEKTEKML